MTSKELIGRVKNKRDTASNWAAANPVILNGEIILVDTAAGELRTKTGDGSKKYSELPFDDEVIRNLITESKYTHPTHSAASSGLYKITVDELGHITAVTAVTKSDITSLGIPAQDTNTTYTVATTTNDGLMASTDKTKLDGIATGANNYTHPAYTSRTSGLYKITVDATGHVSAVTAASKSDITALGIPAQDTTYSVATTSANGLMSSTDKTKLDGIATGANNYTHPTYTAATSGLYKVTVDSSGHVSATTAVAKSDITALGIPAQDTNTTYSNATTSTAGLMSTADKSKLDGVAANAEVNVQSDWSITDTSSDAYIKNKPDLTVYATTDLTNISDSTFKAKVTSSGFTSGSQVQLITWEDGD